MDVIEKANAARKLIPDRYDLKVRQIKAIKETCDQEIFDMITMAFYFGFYRALDSINGEKQREMREGK